MHLDTHMTCSHEKKCQVHVFTLQAGKNLKGRSYILFLSSTNLTRPQFESEVSTQSNDNSLSSKDMHHHAHWGILYLSTTPEERRERKGGRREGEEKGEEGRKGDREGGREGDRKERKWNKRKMREGEEGREKGEEEERERE